MDREDEGEFSPEEEQLLRFQFENELPLKAANLGFDMDQLVHIDDAGKHLIQSAIDGVHFCMMRLLECDLQSAEARMLQIHGLGYKYMIDTVRETLETGNTAAIELADAAEFEEDDDDGQD